MYIVIDRIGNQVHYCNDEHELGYLMDYTLIPKYNNYFDYKITRYNKGKVISIRMIEG